MRILRNYILKKLLTSLIYSFIIITLIMSLGNIIKISDMVIRKGFPIKEAIYAILSFIPYIMKYTLPLSCLLGTLFSLGEMIANNEVLAIRSAGLSVMRILIIFIIVGLIVSLILFILNDKIIPYYHYKYRCQIKITSVKNVNYLLEPGILHDYFLDNTLVKIGDIHDNQLQNVLIFQFNDNEKLNTRIFAKRAIFVIEDNYLKLRLEDGWREIYDPQNIENSYKINFKSSIINISLAPKTTNKIEKKEADMSIEELKEKISFLKKRKISESIPEFLREIHERISFSFSPLVFIILATGISLMVKQKAKSVNFTLAIFIGILYYVLLLVGRLLYELKFFSILSLWLPNIIIGGLGAYLIYRNVYPK